MPLYLFGLALEPFLCMGIIIEMCHFLIMVGLWNIALKNHLINSGFTFRRQAPYLKRHHALWISPLSIYIAPILFLRQI